VDFPIKFFGGFFFIAFNFETKPFNQSQF
jgi:hypothetical protein